MQILKQQNGDKIKIKSNLADSINRHFTPFTCNNLLAKYFTNAL